MAHLTQDSTFTLGRRPAGLIYADKAKSFGGYTLFAPQTAEGRVYLVDEQGEVAHQWQLPVRAGRDAVLLPTVIWVITAATALQRTSIRRGISGTAATSTK